MDRNDAAAFWIFSLDVYAKPGVAASCISLQDRHDFDVNLLLLCLWLAEMRQLALDQGEISSLLTHIEAPRVSLVHPIRRARRWFRQWAPEPRNAEHGEVYAALEAAELLAERTIQAILIEGVADNFGTIAVSNEAAARASLEDYRQLLAAPDAAAASLSLLTSQVLPA